MIEEKEIKEEKDLSKCPCCGCDLSVQFKEWLSEQRRQAVKKRWENATPEDRQKQAEVMKSWRKNYVMPSGGFNLDEEDRQRRVEQAGKLAKYKQEKRRELLKQVHESKECKAKIAALNGSLSWSKNMAMEGLVALQSAGYCGDRGGLYVTLYSHNKMFDISEPSEVEMHLRSFRALRETKLTLRKFDIGGTITYAINRFFQNGMRTIAVVTGINIDGLFPNTDE